MPLKEDKELREFKNLMTPPATFEDGFGWRTVLMALFIGLILAPANVYLQLVPLALMVFNSMMGRVNQFGLGYAMFRLTSDVEKLPFPMAPLGAMGITALADVSERKNSWKFRVFSIGAVAGIAFGFIYLAVP